MKYRIIKDELNPDFPIEKTRRTVRAYPIYQGKLVLVHINCTDKWGLRNHYETPGGGVEKGETCEEALIRELKEELGAEGEIIKHLGKVAINYNLVKRRDISDVFVFKVNKLYKNHLTELEKSSNMEIRMLELDEYISVLNNPRHSNIEFSIYNRDKYLLEKNIDFIRKCLKESKLRG